MQINILNWKLKMLASFLEREHYEEDFNQAESNLSCVEF